MGKGLSQKQRCFFFYLGVNKVVYKIIHGNFDTFIIQEIMCSRKPKLLVSYFLSKKIRYKSGS